MLIDAHAHFNRPDELSARADVRTLFCGTNPETAAEALALSGENRLVSCGVHPWYSDRFTASDTLPFIRESAALGEIGLDSMWCDVDMTVQRRAYTLPKLVHWYSCEDYLFDYLDQDCYFTIGPDHETNPAVQAVLRHVPLNRILTETDGLDAVAWALNRPVEPTEINRVLRGELAAIAWVHGIDPTEAEVKVEANFERFLHGFCI